MEREELIERLGRMVEQAQQYVDAAAMPVPSKTRVDGLKRGLAELRDEARALYFDAGGVDVWG